MGLSSVPHGKLVAYKSKIVPNPGHPWPAWGYYNNQATGLPDFLDHPVKESRGRVSISSETRLVYVPSIYVPSILVWDWRYIQWNFVVQTSGK